MRQTTKDFLDALIRCIPVEEPVYEFGALQVPDQLGFADLRSMFPGKKYVGVDMREGIGVDMVLDLHAIALEPECVGTVLCLETLEHVEYPHRALSEIHRILKPNGFVVISSGMDFPIHGYPYDYWRFTPEAFRTLLKPFQNHFVGYAGKDTFPHTVVGIGFKGVLPDMHEFQQEYTTWQMNQKPSKLRESLKRVTPPILVPLLGRISRSMFPTGERRSK